MRARKHLLIIKAIIKKKIWSCWHAKYVGGYSIAINCIVISVMTMVIMVIIIIIII